MPCNAYLITLLLLVNGAEITFHSDPLFQTSLWTLRDSAMAIFVCVYFATELPPLLYERDSRYSSRCVPRQPCGHDTNNTSFLPLSSLGSPPSKRGRVSYRASFFPPRDLRVIKQSGVAACGTCMLPWQAWSIHPRVPDRWSMTHSSALHTTSTSATTTTSLATA